MNNKYSERKTKRKQVRCRAIVCQETGIPASDDPTLHIGICNAGLSTGATDESILEETMKYGQIRQLTMIPNKSYCFLTFNDIEGAVKVFQQMHGKAALGQGGAVIYMSYFSGSPAINHSIGKVPPPGALLLEEFITEEEEKLLLHAIEEPTSGALKNRIVKHFGYEFLYDTNLVDPNKPLASGIPQQCNALWTKLGQIEPSLSWFKPDQLTVNHYMPGHGIPPHVDTHSAFCDPIVSLSLESDVVMDFRKSNQRVSVFLPRRSLLVMSGESRYDWTHGITPRIMDIVLTSNNTLSTKARGKRTSFTFRKIRTGPCECSYPTLCDSRLSSSKVTKKLDEVAKKLEEINVHSIYDQIATHFSETRHSPWPNVAQFVNSFAEGSVILDVGCGNGKYLSVNKKALEVGCDRSEGLLQICSAHGQHVFKCDCLSLPVRSSSVDGAISIAVIHHLASEDRRLQAVREMVRILRPGGLALIYVWAKKQTRDSKKSSYLRQNKAVNKGKVSEAEQRQRAQAEDVQFDIGVDVNLPVHTNRTEFLEQDIFVPWKLKTVTKDDEKKTFLRFYHVFEEMELERLCEQVCDARVDQSYYDQGNHCIVLRKL